MSDKITQLSRSKAEDRTGIRDAINDVAADAHLGNVRAVAVVAISDDNTITINVNAGTNEMDRRALSGALDEAKARLLDRS